MNNNIVSVRIASTIVATYYENLKKHVWQGTEYSEEYYRDLNVLRKAINGETQIYNNLTDEDYITLSKYFKGHPSDNLPEARIYTKVRNYERLNDASAIVLADDILFASVITSKLLIDVLKLASKKIEELDEDKEIIKTYSNILKYVYLSSNNYIEKLALEKDYNIDRLPVISFEIIQQVSAVPFMDYVQDLIMQYIDDSILELVAINEEDPYLAKYCKIFELSRIETMIPYLNKANLLKVKELCNMDEFKDSLEDIKKLIKKKEKDLN